MKPFVQIHFFLEMLWRLNSKVGRSWGLRPQRYFIFSPTGIFWFRHTLHFGFEHNTAIQLQTPPILIPKAQGCGFAPFQTLGHIWYLYLLSNQHTFHWWTKEQADHNKRNKEKNWRRRKIKEAVYINALNPTESMVRQGILNLENGYEFDPIWSGFNPDIRNFI